MTVTSVLKDPEALTMVLTAEFDASPERVWELWADPRQLERWWKPAIAGGFAKHGKHEALADILESVEELKYYREHFIKL